MTTHPFLMAEEPVKYWLRPPEDPTPVAVGRGVHLVHLALTDQSARQLAALLVRNADELDGYAVRVGVDILTAEAAPPVMLTEVLHVHAGLAGGVLHEVDDPEPVVEADGGGLP